MISLETAIDTVIKNTKHLHSFEEVSLWESLGRVLAVDIVSDINMPPFNKSAVDGFACRRADIEGTLIVIEVIPAGKMPTNKVEKGQCSKIMTGAPVPEGADCVVMVEDIDEVSENVIKCITKFSKTNIAPFAQDVRIGDVVLAKGVLIEPQHIAILAAVGIDKVEVSKKPIVTVLTTGDELVETEVKPKGSQIRNSNGHQLYTQVIRAGGSPIYGGIVNDVPSLTKQAISNALNKSDIVVLTGGVSMGDFDFVPQILQELDVELKFQTIAVQPGKPTVFGVKGDKLIFGLPGNPVSSFLQFEILVRLSIHKMMGIDSPKVTIQKMPLANDFSRKRSERLALVPAIITQLGEVDALDYHGSAHIFALASATCVIVVPVGVNSISKGDLVDVRPF
jgi:molybdopterin molybdotransferase